MGLVNETLAMNGKNSIVVPSYMNKGDIKNCADYREIKLRSRRMKLWERTIQHHLQNKNLVIPRLNWIYASKETTQVILILRKLMENLERRKTLNMVINDKRRHTTRNQGN